MDPTSPVALLIQLIIDNHIIHFLVFDLFIHIHQNDISFNISWTFSRQVDILVSFKKGLLQVYIYGIWNFAFLDFVQNFFGRDKHHLVSLLDGIA